MEQQPLFESDVVVSFYSKKPGSRKKWLVQEVTLYEDVDFPLIYCIVETFKNHPTKREMLASAKRAYTLINVRPFGDEFFDGTCSVYYLTEK